MIEFRRTMSASFVYKFCLYVLKEARASRPAKSHCVPTLK
jgi:hypothetical protein